MQTQKKNFLLIVFIFNYLFLPAHVSAKEHIYILAGQSNMMGKGKTYQLPANYRQTPHNIKFYYQGRPRELAKYSYFGPEVSFAHAIAKAYPHDTHIIIKTVATGSSIQQWVPGSRLYQGMLRQVKFAHITDQQSIDAVVWMQGEADAKTKHQASQYEGTLSRFINGLRQQLNSPHSLFLMGEINPQDPAFSMTAIVQQAQQHVQQSSPNTLLVSTDGLGKLYDHVHYNTKGQIELGKRFANAYIQTQQRRNSLR